MTRRQIEDLTPDECQCLHVAAIVGVSDLACELERIGYSTPEDSLEDARGLRWMILDAASAPPAKIRAAEEELRRRRAEREE